MPTKLEKESSSAERRNTSLDERAATLARESRRLHERTRELEALEAAMQYREQALRRREAELDNDTTNPRSQGQDKPVDWNLPTIAGTIEEAHAYMESRRANVPPPPPKTALARQVNRLREICSANPLATFALGFACGAMAFIIMWVISQ